jgi:hypothetical protein
MVFCIQTKLGRRRGEILPQSTDRKHAPSRSFNLSTTSATAHAVESEKFNSMLFEGPPDSVEISHLHCERTVNSLAS